MTSYTVNLGRIEEGQGPKGPRRRRAFLTDLLGADTRVALKVENRMHKLAASGPDVRLFGGGDGGGEVSSPLCFKFL